MYFLNLGNSGTINIGEAIITIGNPLGFRDTLSYGIIKNTMEKDKRFFLVGMDTNPGNSGGLIYSLRKQAVIGVISAVINSSDQQSAGISVGIAIDPIKDILKKVGVRFVYRENDDEI
jgi:serine protease Do